jgi:hypothetical protein
LAGRAPIHLLAGLPVAGAGQRVVSGCSLWTLLSCPAIHVLHALLH